MKQQKKKSGWSWITLRIKPVSSSLTSRTMLRHRMKQRSTLFSQEEKPGKMKSLFLFTCITPEAIIWKAAQLQHESITRHGLVPRAWYSKQGSYAHNVLNMGGLARNTFVHACKWRRGSWSGRCRSELELGKAVEMSGPSARLSHGYLISYVVDRLLDRALCERVGRLRAVRQRSSYGFQSNELFNVCTVWRSIFAGYKFRGPIFREIKFRESVHRACHAHIINNYWRYIA